MGPEPENPVRCLTRPSPTNEAAPYDHLISFVRERRRIGLDDGGQALIRARLGELIRLRISGETGDVVMLCSTP
jgi:hypothetical protein